MGGCPFDFPTSQTNPQMETRPLKLPGELREKNEGEGICGRPAAGIPRLVPARVFLG